MEQSENNKKASSFRTYRRSQCAVFCKTKELYGGLSNMASGFPLEVNGIHIRTSEALYQACRFPHIPELQRLIIAQSSPMTAKMKGKPYRDRSRSDWDRVRVNIMRWCLRVKLICNWSKFGRLLLSTEERPIVEESRKDDFWGAKIGPDQTLLGINALGRLLMELRRDLATKPKEQLLILQPLDISDFCLYETPIRIVKSANVESAVVFNQSPIKEISSSQDWPVDEDMSQYREFSPNVSTLPLLEKLPPEQKPISERATDPASPVEVAVSLPPARPISDELSFYSIFLERFQRIGAELPIEEMTNIFGLHKAQLTEWLNRAVNEKQIKKLSKPVRYLWIVPQTPEPTQVSQPLLFNEEVKKTGSSSKRRKSSH